MCTSPEKCLHVELANSFACDLGRQFNEERAKTEQQSLTITELLALVDTCVGIIDQRGLPQTAKLIRCSIAAIKTRVVA